MLLKEKYIFINILFNTINFNIFLINIKFHD